MARAAAWSSRARAGRCGRGTRGAWSSCVLPEERRDARLGLGGRRRAVAEREAHDTKTGADVDVQIIRAYGQRLGRGDPGDEFADGREARAVGVQELAQARLGGGDRV